MIRIATVRDDTPDLPMIERSALDLVAFAFQQLGKGRLCAFCDTRGMGPILIHASKYFDAVGYL